MYWFTSCARLLSLSEGYNQDGERKLYSLNSIKSVETDDASDAGLVRLDGDFPGEAAMGDFIPAIKVAT
jgi:hypothetical protein